MFPVSIYDQYPGNERKSRVAHWLRQEHWTLMQAAMLFCDIAPDLATLDDQSRLVSCVSLRNELYGDSEVRFAEMREFESEEEGSTDDDNGSDGNHGRPIKPLAGQLADVLQTMNAALAAGTVKASMPPASWVTYAEEKGIAVPWLAWGRSKPRQFPWLRFEGRRVRVGRSGDGESHKPALTAAVKGRNEAWVWQQEARRIATELDAADAAAPGNLFDAVGHIAERVSDQLRVDGVYGSQGPLNAGTILRDALSGAKWNKTRRGGKK